MTRWTTRPGAPRRPGWRAVAGAAGVAAGAAAGVLAVAAGATHLGVDVPLPAAGALGAALGLVASPAVRMRLERRASAGGGLLSLVLSTGLLSALLALLGLSVLVPAAATSAAVYAVLVVPGRRRLVESSLVVVASSVAALGAQAAGWVDGVVPAQVAALLGAALLAFTGPTVANTASVSRRAQVAALALEAERREHLTVLEAAADHDHLTGLLGRRGVVEPLRAATLSASEQWLTGVLFIDLDGFKAVNDAHGHAAGDQLLVVVAQRLRRCVRGNDHLARTGGDEFVVVLPGLDGPEEAEEVAERVRAAVAQEVALADGSRVSVSASTGVVTTARPRDPDELLSEADTAMYEAKRASRAARAAAALPAQRSPRAAPASPAPASPAPTATADPPAQADSRA